MHPPAWGALITMVYEICSEADDRPSEETNRKLLFPADKTLYRKQSAS